MEINKAAEEETIYEGVIILARIIGRAITEEISNREGLLNRRGIGVAHIENSGDMKGEQNKRLVISVSKVAKLLGMSRSAVYQAVHSGQIPSIRIGARIIIPRVGLSRFLEGMVNDKDHGA